MDFNTALGLRPGDEPVGASVVPATVTVHLLSRARLAPLVGKGRVLRKASL